MNIPFAGLNTVTAMTHYRRVTIDPELNQTIQCHNIGGHWVTSSTITGKIIVYESLSTGLNDALKRQLVHLYKHLAKDDGQFEVTVILQQLQNGGCDCGLFCIANAVALSCQWKKSSILHLATVQDAGSPFKMLWARGHQIVSTCLQNGSLQEESSPLQQILHLLEAHTNC